MLLAYRADAPKCACSGSISGWLFGSVELTIIKVWNGDKFEVAVAGDDILRYSRKASSVALLSLFFVFNPVIASGWDSGAAVAAQRAGTKSLETRLPEKADRPIKDKWAVIIGINNFKDPTIPQLQFPAKDASDFADFLVQKGNFARDHVLLLTNENATRDNIRDAIGGNWLPRRVEKDDLVLIFASTHGSPKELDVAGENFLVAYDSDPQNLYVTGIRFSDLAPEIKERTGCDRVVLLLDACNSGAASVGGKGLVRTSNFDVAALAGEGQIVISSSASNQRSFESKRYKNGVFTRQLIDALQVKPQNTSLNEAFNRLKEQVETEVRFDRQLEQTPVMRSRWSGGELILLAVPAGPRSVPGSAGGVDVSAGETFKRAKALYDQKKYEEALPLLVAAARSGHPESEYFYGVCLYRGHAIPVDKAKAVEWFQKAAAQNVPGALNFMGMCYQLGDGVPCDFVRAVEYYQKAADLGLDHAQSNLGLMYEFGRGVPKNYGKAFEWFQKAADQGDKNGQNSVGYFYAQGNGVPQNFEKAAMWYQKAADQGSAEAQDALGKLYFDGQGVPKNDTKAVEWYRKAADQGDTNGIFHLAYMYNRGLGAPVNYGEALRLYGLNVSKGHAPSIANLGGMYQDGHGVTRDYARAAELYEQAAAKGNDFAMYALARLYFDGLGVSRDIDKVRSLLTKAAADGYADAQESLNKLNNMNK